MREAPQSDMDTGVHQARPKGQRRRQPHTSESVIRHRPSWRLQPPVLSSSLSSRTPSPALWGPYPSHSVPLLRASPSFFFSPPHVCPTSFRTPPVPATLLQAPLASSPVVPNLPHAATP